MSRATSSPFTVRVAWTPPYDVPTRSGEVVLIGVNDPSDVKPSEFTASQWNYALFTYYGGGALCEDFSVAGAWVVAGSGGHDVPPNVGAAVFDFADATWKRIDNANGVPWRPNDYLTSELHEGEIIEADDDTPEIPAPAHLYKNMAQRRTTQGGGPKGSFLIFRHRAQDTASNSGSGRAHSFDLDTGLWTRTSTNTVLGGYQRVAQYDPATDRFYLVNENIASSNQLLYLDASDWTYKTQSMGATPPDDGSSYSFFIDPVRHMAVIPSSRGNLRALVLDGTGVSNLTLGGTLPAWAHTVAWNLYPADGCWYAIRGNGDTELTKITPPPLADDPKAGTWTISTVPLSTPLATQNPSVYSPPSPSGAHHENRFFYVPSLGCFAWIPGSYGGVENKVALIKP